MRATTATALNEENVFRLVAELNMSRFSNPRLLSCPLSWSVPSFSAVNDNGMSPFLSLCFSSKSHLSRENSVKTKQAFTPRADFSKHISNNCVISTPNFFSLCHSALCSDVKKKIITRCRRLSYNYPNLHLRDFARHERNKCRAF